MAQAARSGAGNTNAIKVIKKRRGNSKCAFLATVSHQFINTFPSTTEAVDIGIRHDSNITVIHIINSVQVSFLGENKYYGKLDQP